MSVEATGWAFRQKVPPKPKVVLLALADQADETTGRVCYGKTDMKHIAGKSSCGERSLYRYISALVRNGYVIRESGKQKGQASTYWLCLDRLPAKSLKEWQWKGPAETDELDDDVPGDGGDPVDDTDDAVDDPETQDVEVGSAKLADPQSGENSENASQIGRGGLPQGGRQESSDNQNINRAASERIRSSSFSRQAQDLDVETRSIRKRAEATGARYFVILGSRAWNDWLAWRKRHGLPASLPTCTGTGEYANKRGWYLPSLFPPSEQQTGPPDDGPQISKSDAEALSK